MRLALAILLTGAGVAHAGAEDYGKGTIIFARGQSLFRVEPTGKAETEVATFVTKAPVRVLRTDATAKTLLVDIGGTWGWMPLDGSTKTILSLGCAEGPASLTEDGTKVLCRAPKGSAGPSMVIDLAAQTAFFVDVPIVGARLAGDKIVWTDKTGVWSAPPRDLAKKTQVGPEAPLRSFLASPDGSRAVGVWADQVFDTLRTKKPAEILMGVQLDGIAARRRAIKNAVPVEWSHDAKWILAQDGATACLMGATGGEYKCWRGYTAASTSPDGRWTIVLGNRDGSRQSAAPKATPAKKDAKAPKAPNAKTPDPVADAAKPDGDVADGEESEDDEAPIPDVVVAPPSGPLALYRARLEGAFTETPVLLVKIVDGAAVWIPAKP